MVERPSNPHVDLGTGFSPLADLMSRALLRFGDAATMQPSGDLALLLLDMANMLVEEINMHPYWNGAKVAYYEHPADRRPIPDNIITAGLAGLYASQQGSDKAAQLLTSYYRTLNSVLWHDLAGNSKLRIRTFDKGYTDPITGLDLVRDEAAD